MNEEKSDRVTLKAELVELYDDVVEFNDYCSFLCDAASCLFTDAMEGEPDTHTVMGLKRHCNDLKERAEKLESMINNLYKQSHTSGQITTLKPLT